jgi:hypothetical protein
MEDRLTSTQKLILSELIKANHYIYIFTIAKKLHLDIYNVTSSLKKLLGLNYVKEDTDNDLRVRITLDGKQWFLKNSSYSLSLTKEKPWRVIPASFVQPQISPDDFYIPLPQYLDKKFVKKYSKKGGNKAGG